MILSDGTDTRDEVRSPGPWCDGMAIVLDGFYMNGDTGDAMETDSSGGGACQYGRRVLRWDGSGFVGSLRFATADEAAAWMADEYPTDDEED